MDFPTRPRALALAVIGCGAAVAVGLSAALPSDVATHFSASGAADARMSRGEFAATMLALCFLLPLACLFGLSALRRPSKPSVPRRGVYFPPSSKSAPAVGPWASALFSAALSIFMDFVAWLVWSANRFDPPVLSASSVWPGTAAFVAFLAAWAVAISSSRRR